MDKKKLKKNVNTTVNNLFRQNLTLYFNGVNFTAVALAPRLGASETPTDKIKNSTISKKRTTSINFSALILFDCCVKTPAALVDNRGFLRP